MPSKDNALLSFSAFKFQLIELNGVIGVMFIRISKTDLSQILVVTIVYPLTIQSRSNIFFLVFGVCFTLESGRQKSLALVGPNYFSHYAKNTT